MELRQLAIFRAAAQNNNFTRTAEQLGYTQPNITNQIRLLEEELNIRLFDRIGKSIQLTSEGKLFLKNVEIILQRCEIAKAEFTSDIFRGVLNIGSAETICVYRLPKLLLEYRRRYPLVEIRVQTEMYNQLCDLAKNNIVDIVFALTGEIKDPDLIIKTLQNEDMTIVASPFHALAKKQWITPEDFSKECLILTTEGCGYRTIVLSTLKNYKATPKTIMELSSVGAIKQCTAIGLGLAILPHFAVQEEIKMGSLIELKWDGPIFDVRTQLIYHKDKWLSPAVRAFLSLCEEISL